MQWLAIPDSFRREGGTYYLRARVPDALRSIIGKTEIRRSLRTKALKEARRLVNIESIKVDADFAKAEKKLKGSGKVNDMSRDEMLWHACAELYELDGAKNRKILGMSKMTKGHD